MATRFTKSKDGVERMTAHFSIRLTREQLADLKALAEFESTDWRRVIEGHLLNFIHMGVDEKLRYYRETEGE